MSHQEERPTPRSPLRFVWITAGTISVGLGIVGIVLPLLPTTPFVILAAWCFAKSSPELRDRLVNSRLLGPSLRNWERERAIARRAKVSASALMTFVVLLSVALQVPTWIIVIQVLVAACVLTFLWTRPEPQSAP